MAQLPDLIEKVREHKIGRELLSSDPDVVLASSVLDIPPADRAETFTTGTLEESFVQPPAVLISRKETSILATFYLGPKFMGHRGFVHGGVIATILDECCGRAAVCHFERVQIARAKEEGKEVPSIESVRSGAVTAQLSVTFVAPIPTSSSVIVHATIDDSAKDATSSRKAKVTAKLWRLPGTEQERAQDDVLCAEAHCVFIEPRQMK